MCSIMVDIFRKKAILFEILSFVWRLYQIDWKATFMIQAACTIGWNQPALRIVRAWTWLTVHRPFQIASGMTSGRLQRNSKMVSQKSRFFRPNGHGWNLEPIQTFSTAYGSSWGCACANLWHRTKLEKYNQRKRPSSFMRNCSSSEQIYLTCSGRWTVNQVPARRTRRDGIHHPTVHAA